MKKTILFLCILLASATITFAQGGAAKKQALIKLGLKEEVRLSDAQIDIVMAIENEFKPKTKALRSDQSLSEADKKAKTQILKTEKSKKIEGALGKDLAKKVEQYYTSLKKGDGDEARRKKANPED